MSEIYVTPSGHEVVVTIVRRRAIDQSMMEWLYDDLADRMAAAYQDLMATTQDDADGHEFHGNQYVTVASSPKPTTVKAKAVRGGFRELFSSGHAFSKEEVMKILNITDDKLFHRYLAMLKNEKWAGSKGALNIQKLSDGTYQVVKPDGTPAPPEGGKVDEPKPEPTPEPKSEPKPTPDPEPKKPEPEAPAKTPEPVQEKPKTSAPASAPTSLPISFAERVARAKAWKPVANTKDLAVAAVNAGLVKKANFGKISSEAANIHMTSLASHVARFPALGETQAHAGSIQVYNQDQHREVAENFAKKLIQLDPKRYPTPEAAMAGAMQRVRKRKAPKNCWAFATANPGDRGVSLNEVYATEKNLPALNEGLARCVKTKFHPVGCDTLKSVMDHEYGHQLDYLLGLSKHPEVLGLHTEARKPAAGSEYQDPSPSKNMENNVSRYAATNMAEFIAESWAEYNNNPEPRPIAAKMGKLVEKIYAEKYPTV